MGMASFRLLLCYGRAPRGNEWGAVWLFTSMRGLRAVAQGLVCPEFSGISSCWTVTQDASIQLWGPCPFKTFKKHSLFFVTGVPASGPAQRSCCPVSLVSSTPHMHCVCALVRMASAGYLAVLGSLSLPAPTPLLPPEAGLYLTHFTRCWVLTGVDVDWLLSCMF